MRVLSRSITLWAGLLGNLFPDFDTILQSLFPVSPDYRCITLIGQIRNVFSPNIAPRYDMCGGQFHSECCTHQAN